MMRHCDGRDTNLTRHIPFPDFIPETMTRSPWDKIEAGNEYVVINCNCGLIFDDVDHMTIYPHQAIVSRALRFP
jgi:hypothetical protein